jgi:CDP-diacylglycerol---glycerol-3-phosphate 3-phosphatidyltransferase
MSSSQHAPDLRRADSILSSRVKQSGRALLAPIVRLAMALGLTPNTVTVIGLGITIVASVLVGFGWLLVGAAILTAGSLLDAVDGALARAQGGVTAFGGFLDSTLDRSGEAIVYIGIGAWALTTLDDPTWPVIAAMIAMGGSFLVSYAHARAQGIGLAADVGLAPRTERLVFVIIGIALAGIGFVPGLIGALVILATLTVATVIQRIWHVWRSSQVVALDSKEN